MRWAEINIETASESAEIISGLLMAQGCHGTAITGDGIVTVTGYLPVDDQLEPRLLALREEIRRLKSEGYVSGSGTIRTTPVEDDDWAVAWRRFYKPMRIGKKIVIKPSWEEYEPQPGDIVVELDPGMAFGSGQHASTALCLQALEELVKPGDMVLDIGTGSGILAIAAAKLGASRVIASDDDPTAVAVAAENVHNAGLDDIVEVRQGDLLAPIPEKADIIVSNIVADVVIRLAPDISSRLNPGGVWVSAGIVNTRLDDVTTALHQSGIRIIKIAAQEEWVAVISVPSAE